MSRTTTAHTRVPMPKELTLKAEKAVWEKVVGSYTADYFNEGDTPLLIGYCRMKVLADKAHKLLKVEGEILENSAGNPILNPRLKVMKEATTACATLATKLRIAPNGRTRPEKAKHSSRQANESKVFAPDSDWRAHQKLDG